MNEQELIEAVVGAAYEVSNTIGCGFLEIVHRRAMFQELTLRDLDATTQVTYPVSYKGHTIGEYCADLVVEGSLIVETKCADQFSNRHIAQCLNYLRTSGLRTALLINFQNPKVEWRKIASRS